MLNCHSGFKEAFYFFQVNNLIMFHSLPIFPVTFSEKREMSSISILLLSHLNELTQDDFERFKWSLMKDKAQGFESISRRKLEKAKPFEVVDLMVNQYESSEATKITIQVLRQMEQKKLASDLEKKLEEEGKSIFFPKFIK